jgi:hypothetical protein
LDDSASVIGASHRKKLVAALCEIAMLLRWGVLLSVFVEYLNPQARPGAIRLNAVPVGWVT